MSECKHVTKFKIPKGTVIKLYGSPAQLNTSIEVVCDDGKYIVDKIKFIDEEKNNE